MVLYQFGGPHAQKGEEKKGTSCGWHGLFCGNDHAQKELLGVSRGPRCVGNLGSGAAGIVKTGLFGFFPLVRALDFLSKLTSHLCRYGLQAQPPASCT